MVFLSEVSRGSRSSERGAAGARRKPCCPALASLPQEEGRIQHHPPRLFQMLECTDLGNELDCVVSLFATYLRSQCLGMQSLVLRAILGLTQRPDTVSRGSRQHHECSGLGWAGPGLSWLGTFPGSGEGAAGGRRCASIPAPPALFLWGCAGQPCLPAPRCPMGRSQRDGTAGIGECFRPGGSPCFTQRKVFFSHRQGKHSSCCRASQSSCRVQTATPALSLCPCSAPCCGSWRGGRSASRLWSWPASSHHSLTT